MINLGLGAVTLDTLESVQTHTRHQLLPSDMDSGVVSMTGVLLQQLADTASRKSDVNDAAFCVTVTYMPTVTALPYLFPKIMKINSTFQKYG